VHCILRDERGKATDREACEARVEETAQYSHVADRATNVVCSTAVLRVQHSRDDETCFIRRHDALHTLVEQRVLKLICHLGSDGDCLLEALFGLEALARIHQLETFCQIFPPFCLKSTRENSPHEYGDTQRACMQQASQIDMQAKATLAPDMGDETPEQDACGVLFRWLWCLERETGQVKQQRGVVELRARQSPNDPS